jgi:hypothetical protein
MAATYNWSVGFINAKKAFTDKHGNFRENVIKSVELIFTGIDKYIEEVDGEEKEKERKESKSVVVNFELFDLSSFQDYTELNKETILIWALDKINPMEKLDTENFVKNLFKEFNFESNLINIEIND